jgi:quercetin dioxygenase-like cupin family protein
MQTTLNVATVPDNASDRSDCGGPWHEGTRGERLAVRISSLQTNGAYAVVESIVEPGCAVPMHLHRNEEEHFIVISGLYRLAVEENVFEISSGASITIPKGARHSWRNLSKEPSRLLVVITPGAFEQCIQTINNNPPEKLEEVAASFGCHIVGPPVSA